METSAELDTSIRHAKRVARVNRLLTKSILSWHVIAVFIVPYVLGWKTPLGRLDIAAVSFSFLSASLLILSFIFKRPKIGSLGATVYAMLIAYIGVVTEMPQTRLFYIGMALLSILIASNLWVTETNE